MPTPNKVCRVCGTPYYACKACDESRGLHYKQVTCSPQCFITYMERKEADTEKDAENKNKNEAE